MTARAARIAWRAGLALAGLGGLGSLAGCLSVPDGPAPMCHVSSDCNTDQGEVCEEGVCWGDPPPGPFAAVISPPSTRRDLVPREFAEIAIPPAGWMGDLPLERAVSFTGRIVASCPPPMNGCDSTTLGATVTVTRSSQFHGGPGFKTVVNVDAGADSFAIALPPRKPGDAPYTVTVTPEDTDVPPLRLQLGPTDSLTQKLELGGPDLPVVRGTLTNALGQGLAGYRVVALGRWEATASPTEVSSVSLTDSSGAYAVTLSDGLYGTVELVARPPHDTVGATIRLANLDAKLSAACNVVEPVTLGNPVRLAIAVTGVDRGGSIAKIGGATVSVAGGSAAALTPCTTGGKLVTYTINSDLVTDDQGMVNVDLMDGAGILDSYRLAIVPPASSRLGVLFDQKLVLASGPPLRLPARVALSGTILNSDGKPLGNVAVTARPSLRFLWTLDATPQAFVSTIPAATAVTSDDGLFVLWVDPSVAQVWGSYDLLIEPPAKARAPSSVKTEISIPRDGTLDAVTLGDITLPDAAFVHGRVVGPDGSSVEGAELKLYVVGFTSDLALCTEVAHAPSSCPIPAGLQGRNSSDSDGTVRLALPR